MDEKVQDTSMYPQVAAPEKSGVSREEPQIEAQRANLVSDWQDKILGAIDHWKDDFKRMRDDMQLAYAGADKTWAESDQYVTPIISRHINQAVAGLYAKNPKVLVERKKRLEYTVWDGRADTLKAAMEMVAQQITQMTQMAAAGGGLPGQSPMPGMPGMPPMGAPQMPGMPSMPPGAGMMPGGAEMAPGGMQDSLTPTPHIPDPMAVIQDVSKAQQRGIMLKRVCKTMQILIGHYFKEQSPNFKKQLKQLVRRTKICGVGYIFLGYQRLLEKQPDIVAKIEDISAQLAKIESLHADITDGVMPEDAPQREELKLMLQDMQNMVEVITREGPVFDFPRTVDIIVDTKCQQLSTLVGATWFARQFHLDADEIQEVYKIDIAKGGYKAYVKTKDAKTGDYNYAEGKAGDKSAKSCARVWEVWDKANAQVFTLIEGYKDFAREPAAPEVRLERFWPLFVLTFNDIEHESKIYPLSDVHMLRHAQMEYNRSRQYRRLHREANKPKYVTVAGRLSDKDIKKLESHQAHAVIELNALNQGEQIENLIQAFKTVPMDPALYETNSEMEDVLRTVGSQEANIGGTSGATATESSIAENSRTSSLDCNVDDLDELLSELTNSTGQMLLLKLDISTVKKIAGEGAVWPELNGAEIAEELLIDIKAGSSGRPNKAADLANMERAMPYMMQANGINITPLMEKYAELLDIDIEDLIMEGLPSQVALNAMASKMVAGAAGGQPGTGNPASDPAQQGAAGATNAPSAVANEPGPQPSYPAPAAV